MITSPRSLGLMFALFLATISVALNAQTVIKMVSPRVTSPVNGAEMYTAYCAACHGASLKGDGPAAAALRTHPTDLTVLTAQNNGKFPTLAVYSAIKGDSAMPGAQSVDGMPVWGPVFVSMKHDDSDVCLRLVNLVRYIDETQGR